MSCGTQWHRFLNHLSWVLLEWPPFVIEPWFLLACLCMALTLRLTDCDDPYGECCAGIDHTNWNSPRQGCGTCQALSVDMLLVKLIRFSSDVVWSWPLDVLVLGQCQMLPVTGPWQPAWSYKVIQFVAASAVPEYTEEGSSFTPRSTFISFWPEIRPANIPPYPDIHIYLPLLLVSC